MTGRFNSSIMSVEFAQRGAIHRIGVRYLAVLRPGAVTGVAPEPAVVPGATVIMPTDEQAVAEHAADKESIDHRRVALLVLRRAVQAYVENHPNLQLGRYDGRCLERLHEGRRVADAGHRAVVNLAVDEIGKRDDGALLEFRDAIGFKKRVKVRFDLVKAGYIGVEDVPVGRVYRKRNAEDPTVRTRSRKGIGMLQDRPIPLFLDDWRAAADDGCIGGDERNIDVPVGKEFPGKSPRIEDQVVAFRRLILEFHFPRRRPPS